MSLNTEFSKSLGMALHLRSIGIAPTPLNGKKPLLKNWQNRFLDEEEIEQQFINGNSIGVVCGKISNGLEVIDFDAAGICFNPYWKKLSNLNPELTNKLVVQETPSAGYHIAYFCPDIETPGNQKLAVKCEKQGNVELLIETRGTGGQAAVFPSKNYRIVQPGLKEPYHPPTITLQERSLIIAIAKEFDDRQLSEWESKNKTVAGNPAGDRPGDRYNNKTNADEVYELLLNHGWHKHSANDDKIHLTRPGKSIRDGSSATLYSTGALHVFTSNDDSFEPDTTYSPFGVYTMLKHKGDFKAAARAICAEYDACLPQIEKGNQAANSQNKIPEVGGLSLADMEGLFSKEYEWVWGNHLPKGLPIIIGGREGTGKTTIALQIAKEILGSHRNTLVYWFSTEGTVKDTYVKAIELGIDKNRFVIAYKNESRSENGQDFTFNFKYQKDLNRLNELLSNALLPISAVFIDSIRGMTAHTPNEEETGKTMMKINAIVCDRYQCALCYLHHLNKKETGSLIDKLTGTTAIPSAVRLVLCILQSGSKKTRKMIAIKNNLSTEVENLEIIKNGNEVAIYNPEETVVPADRDKAEQLLLKLFKDQRERLATEVYNEGEKIGLTADVMRKAKGRLKFPKAYRSGGNWYWSAPF